VLLISFAISVALIFMTYLFIPIPDVLMIGGAVNTNDAYLYLAVSTLAFILGYMLPAIFLKRKVNKKSCKKMMSRANMPTRYIISCLFIGIIGVIIYLVQIKITVGFNTYINFFLSSDSSVETNAMRFATVGISHDEGGLPGIIKMFEINTVIAPFCLMALIVRGYKFGTKFNIVIATLIGFLFLVGVVLRIDRLSLLALIPISVKAAKETKSRKVKFAGVGVAVAMLIFIALQSILRGSQYSLIEWVGLYSHLGMMNLALMMKSVTHHTFGLMGVFSVISWIFHGVNLDIMPNTSFDFVWSPAQNGFSIMYADFSWIGVMVYFFIGMLSRGVDLKVKRQISGPWIEIQCLMSYALLSIWTVPAYGGIEYWVLLILSIMMVNSVVTRKSRSRPKSVGGRMKYDVVSQHTNQQL